jgi:N-methylhydantoinase B/oxoprolinase/acetone carboxylase alpha subunit
MEPTSFVLGELPPTPDPLLTDIDPVTLRVLGGKFHTIAREMANIILRMSSSPVVREAEDLGAGLFDARGREICESESSPMHIGSLPWYIRGFMRRLEGVIQDGDVVLHNHPYFGAAHSPDVGVAVPIFWDGKLVAFAAATAHLLDVGGAHPGLNCDAFDVYSEARLLNGIRWFRGGVLDEDVDRLVFDNVRTESMNRGDVMAMKAACEIGRRRFLQLLDRYGYETVFGCAYEWMSYSERALRREIARVPDGDYRAPTAWLDDDAVHRGQPLRVETLVSVRGDSVFIDLTGSSPEVESGFNVPFEGSLLVSCYFAIRSILLDDSKLEVPVPHNEGIFRPIHVTAPLGSIFNPRFPRACFARFCQVQRVVDNVILALAPVLPEETTAGNSAACHDCLYSGFSEETGEYWMYMDVVEGSYGGRHGLDGLDSVDNLMANCRNAPIEETELKYPLRCEQYELRPESAAPGRWRGGVGIVRRTRMLVDGTFSSEGDRSYDAPRGVLGGWSGLGTLARRNPDTPAEEVIPTKVTALACAAGDVIEVREPNAGGYGDPLDRDPQSVFDDVTDDFTSIHVAREAYGVVIVESPEKVLELDRSQTEELRAALRQGDRTTSSQLSRIYPPGQAPPTATSISKIVDAHYSRLSR